MLLSFTITNNSIPPPLEAMANIEKPLNALSAALSHSYAARQSFNQHRATLRRLKSPTTIAFKAAAAIQSHKLLLTAFFGTFFHIFQQRWIFFYVSAAPQRSQRYLMWGAFILKFTAFFSIQRNLVETLVSGVAVSILHCYAFLKYQKYDVQHTRTTTQPI